MVREVEAQYVGAVPLAQYHELQARLEAVEASVERAEERAVRG